MDPPPSVYWPILAYQLESNNMMTQRGVTFFIRSPRAGSASLMEKIRAAVWSVNANIPLADVHTLDYYYTGSMARISFLLVILTIAGGMALLLGVVGLYGVIAYSVAQRTREIGIRMALGAQRQNLMRLFVRHGLLLAGVGVACGLATATAAMSLTKALLFHVSPRDPITYVAVIFGLVATAVLASYIPARRAMNVDPMVALRYE
jgi:putative ABC transport system permease protein